MTDDWRLFLYNIGFLSSLAFGGRILLQWVISERSKESVVPKAFWQLSFCGNVLLMVHSLIQVQFHVFIIQTGNALISWRNLNLLKTPGQQASPKNVIFALISALSVSAALFFIMNIYGHSGATTWFRDPSNIWFSPIGRPVSMAWHICGCVGLILFSSRFWIQWWCAEKQKTSYLGPLFWWISLVGDLLMLVYFARIKDPVNLIGPIFGLIPYIRNLMLIYKNKAVETLRT